MGLSLRDLKCSKSNQMFAHFSNNKAKHQVKVVGMDGLGLGVKYRAPYGAVLIKEGTC